MTATPTARSGLARKLGIFKIAGTTRYLLFGITHLTSLYILYKCDILNKPRNANMDPSIKLTEQTEQVELVTYHDEGDKIEEKLNVGNVEPALATPARDELRNSLTDVLERPYEALNFLWNVNDVTGTLKGAVTVPGDWLLVPNVRQKINKFKFLKADFELRVQVNAQPMNAGRLLLVFFPNYGNLTLLPSSMSHLGGLTGFPHVDLDVAEGSSAVFQIPFAINQSHFDIIRALGNLGSFGIYVYSPLTGSNDVDCTVWITARNVELEMPVGVDIFPVAELQMAGIRISTDGAEAKEKKAGIVSRVAGTAKEAFDALTAIPVISTFANVGSLVAGAVAGVAGLFGWSKPIDDTKTTLFQQEFGRHFATSEGDSKAKILALSRSNKVSHASHVALSNQDEMSISYITSKFTYLTSFTYATESPTNTVLSIVPVSPSACGKQTLIGGVNSFNTFLSYLSAHFSAWRGSIEYKFKLVKTPFHTGRLRFIWIPGVEDSVDINTIDVNSCYSEVYDIRERTEIDFTVPYVSAIPYWTCVTQTGRESAFCHSVPTGVVVVEVLNVLRATTSVASSIEIIVEVRGGPDFEFAYPCIEAGIRLEPESSDGNTISSNKLQKAGVVTKLVRAKNKTSGAAQSSATSSKALSSEKSQRSRGFVKDEAGTKVESVAPKVEMPQPTKKEMIQENLKKVTEKADLDLTEREICLLPKAKGTETVPIVATSRPTHRYTAEQRTALWQEYISNNPTMKNDTHWRLFAKLHPVASCPEDQNYVARGGPGAGLANFIVSQKIQDRMDRGELQFIGSGDNSPAPDVFTFGEMVTSLRQVLKRTQMYLNIVPANARIQPYVTQSIGAAEGEVWRTFFDRFAALYRWQSGGLHITLVPTQNLNQTREVSITPSWQEFTSEKQGRQTTLTTIVHQGQPVVPAVSRFEGITEFLVPFYQPFTALLTSVGAPVYQNNHGANYPHSVLHNNGTCVDINNAAGVRVGRHIAEDFSFHYLIGPPITSRAV